MNSLKVYTPDSFPLQYASINSNLGSAYSVLAFEEKDTEKNLENSINAYQSSLKVYSKDEFPVQFTSVQKSLAEVYYQKSVSSGSDEYIQKTVK